MERKYEGYIKRDFERIKRLEKMEKAKISDNINYGKSKGMTNEAKEKLKKIRPGTGGQAMRISGVDPSDVSVLVVFLRGLEK